MTEWADETLYPFYRQSLSIDRMLYDSETDHQRIRVFENAYWGRVMTLDGVVQTTAGDNFIYHEMLTHVPILAHGGATRVLIIGGGDGGMAREVLRHRCSLSVQVPSPEGTEVHLFRYDDEIVRHEGAWRFRSRRVVSP